MDICQEDNYSIGRVYTDSKKDEMCLESFNLFTVNNTDGTHFGL